MKDQATGTDNPLLQIYASTRGYCHGCRRKLAFTSYARGDARGAWDIDARALRPLCLTCLPGHAPRDSPRLGPAPTPAASVRDRPRQQLGGLFSAIVLGLWGALLGALLRGLLSGLLGGG